MEGVDEPLTNVLVVQRFKMNSMFLNSKF